MNCFNCKREVELWEVEYIRSSIQRIDEVTGEETGEPKVAVLNFCPECAKPILHGIDNNLTLDATGTVDNETYEDDGEFQP